MRTSDSVSHQGVAATLLRALHISPTLRREPVVRLISASGFKAAIDAIDLEEAIRALPPDRTRCVVEMAMHWRGPVEGRLFAARCAAALELCEVALGHQPTLSELRAWAMRRYLAARTPS